jgi:hypothetical protein
LERQTGEWNFVGGYSGQAITEHSSNPGFSALRGFKRAFIGKASYTIDVNRSFSVETAIRQNGQGVSIKPEYTQALGQHWRVTAGLAWIHGSDSDFIGQYQRNSFGIIRFRYSF